MNRRDIIKPQLVADTMNRQDHICPICNRKFAYINKHNIKNIVAHHQSIKTETISKLCNSSYNSAIKEYNNGHCIWVHIECHNIMHSVTHTGNNEKTYKPVNISDISDTDMHEIWKSLGLE